MGYEVLAEADGILLLVVEHHARVPLRVGQHQAHAALVAKVMHRVFVQVVASTRFHLSIRGRIIIMYSNVMSQFDLSYPNDISHGPVLVLLYAGEGPQVELGPVEHG